MKDEVAFDIKKIIEEQKLSDARAANNEIPEPEPTQSKQIISNQVVEESLTVKKPVKKSVTKSSQHKKEVKDSEIEESEIIERIKAYDNGSKDSFMLHLNVNEKIYNMSRQLSAAKKISVTKLLGFSMLELFRNNPELEEAIKKHLKKLEL